MNCGEAVDAGKTVVFYAAEAVKGVVEETANTEETERLVLDAEAETAVQVTSAGIYVAVEDVNGAAGEGDGEAGRKFVRGY